MHAVALVWLIDWCFRLSTLVSVSPAVCAPLAKSSLSRTSVFEPSSVRIARRYLNWLTVLSSCPLTVIFFSIGFVLFVIRFVFSVSTTLHAVSGRSFVKVDTRLVSSCYSPACPSMSSANRRFVMIRPPMAMLWLCHCVLQHLSLCIHGRCWTRSLRGDSHRGRKFKELIVCLNVTVDGARVGGVGWWGGGGGGGGGGGEQGVYSKLSLWTFLNKVFAGNFKTWQLHLLIFP